MRATINFEVNADKVEETMATLVSQEAATLRIAANILDNLGDGPLLQEVNETIDLLQEAAIQLKQYRDMLAGFERARFETMLPQPVPATTSQVSSEVVAPLQDAVRETAETAQQMQQFNEFLSRIQEQATATAQEIKTGEGDGDLSEEG